MSALDPEFKSLLAKLVKTPDLFTPADFQAALRTLISRASHDAQDQAIQSQAGAFLTALHLTHLERRPEILSAAAGLLRSLSVAASVSGAEDDFIVDIVGTGGDGYNTFNVSTTAAVVAAGAGARVCKVCFLYLL